MKVFKIFVSLLIVLCLIWLAEICANLLDQQCQLEKSTAEQILTAIKKFFGVAPPDPWCQSLCNLTGPEIRANIIRLCNVVIISTCCLFVQLRRQSITQKVNKYPNRNDKRRRLKNQRAARRREMREAPKHARKSVKRPLVVSPSDTDVNGSVLTKKSKQSSPPFETRPQSHPQRPQSPGTPLLEGYLYIPHALTTEQKVYRAVLLGPVNDCFKYLTSLLRSLFISHGVASEAIQWDYKLDPEGTINYLTGHSDEIKVDMELNDGINVSIHRAVKVDGILNEKPTGLVTGSQMADTLPRMALSTNQFNFKTFLLIYV